MINYDHEYETVRPNAIADQYVTPMAKVKEYAPEVYAPLYR